MANFGKSLRIYVRLTRWEDYLTFLQLVFGFLLANKFQVSISELALLGKTLFVLAPLLYGGIYTINNLKDAELDKKNPRKKDRPIPAGEISKETASWIALFLVGAGILLSLLLPPQVFPMTIAFLALNFFYTFWAKGVPYLSIAVNASTHVLRLLFGMWLAGNLGYWYLAGVLAAASTGATVSRYLKEISEGGAAGRPVLRFHSAAGLWRIYYAALAVLALFAVFGRPWEGIIGAFFLIWNLVGGVGYSRIKILKKLVDFAWR